MPLHITIDPIIAQELVRAGWSPAFVGANNTLKEALKKATSIQPPLDDTYNWAPAPLDDLFPLWSDVEALTNTATFLHEQYTRLAKIAADYSSRLAHINTLLDIDSCTYGFLAGEALSLYDLLAAAMRTARNARLTYEEALEKANTAEAEWEEAYDNLRRTPNLIAQLWAYWEKSMEAPK